MISIAVAGGRVDAAARGPARCADRPAPALPDRDGARPRGRPQGGASPARTRGWRARGIATGDRSRSRYGLGPGRLGAPSPHARRLRAHGQPRAPRPPSLLETAIRARRGERGGHGARARLSTTVFESGRVVACAARRRTGRNSSCVSRRGRSRPPLDASLEAVSAVAARRRRRQWCATASWSRSRRGLGGAAAATRSSPTRVGSHPWRMTGGPVGAEPSSSSSPCSAWTSRAARCRLAESFAAQGERMLEYVGAEEREALPSIVAKLERRLADVPRGQSHGDFWSRELPGPRRPARHGARLGVGGARTRCRCSTSST